MSRRSKFRMRVALLPALCSLFLFVGLTMSVSGQNTGQINWSTPLLLGDGWWQSITMDIEGRVHVGWYGVVPSRDGLVHDALVYTSRNFDGEWTQNNDVIYTGNGGWTVRNQLAATSDGVLHAAYRNGTSHRIAKSPARAAELANNWSTPITINDLGYYLDMTVDRNDVLHVVYSGGLGYLNRNEEASNVEANPCAFCNDLFYRRSTDGGNQWSPPLALSLEATTGADRVSVFEGASGRLYVIWDEGYDWYIGRGLPQDVRITYSDDGGLTWADPIILNGGGFEEKRPVQIAMSEMRDGSWLVVWRYSNDLDRGIYYQISNDAGKTWTNPAAIPGLVARRINDTPLDDYELITDKVGTTHLFAVALPDVESNSNPILYQVEFRQGLWLAPRRIFYSPEMRPEWPKAVIGIENDIHLTWFIRGLRENAIISNADTTRILKVYYSHMAGNLRNRPTQVFNPTQTPLPSPTPFRRLVPTLTPFPTTQPFNEPVYQASRDIYAANTFLGGLFTSGLFCLAVLAYVRLRR